MTLPELEKDFECSLTEFSFSAQAFLNTSKCTPDTKEALDHISKQFFFALQDTQRAIVEYLRKQP